MQVNTNSLRRITHENNLSHELKEEISSQLDDWESTVTKQETTKENAGVNLEDYEKYFDNENSKLNEKKKKERAENQRTRGNEAIKSKDYD